MHVRRLIALLVLAVAADASRASALSLTVTGGPGLDQGAICATGALCPGTSPQLTLSGSAAVTGSFTYNSGPQTVDFSLTFLSPATFTGSTTLQILAGSTVSAVGVPVISSSLGGGAYLLSQFGSATGSTSLLLSPSYAVVANAPLVSGLSCTVGTGSDQCGVSLGSSGLTLSGVSGSGNSDVFLTFNANVPEPGTALLLLAGLAAAATQARRRAAI